MSEAKNLKNLLNKYSRIFLLCVFLVVVVVLVAGNLDVVGNVLLVVMGFGVVILVHEFGHFIVAKLSGIKVEAFSIGFSPILFGIKKTNAGYRIRIFPGFLPIGEGEDSDGSVLSFCVGRCEEGDTEYRIGLIPFGGFVKMLGQDDVKAVKISDDPRSYANKPAGVRIRVIAAGVILNAVLAIIVFISVFLIGIKQVPPVVGGVMAGTPAAKAGLKGGDEIIEIAGKSKDINFRDIMVAAALSGEEEAIGLKVKGKDGTVRGVEIVPKEQETEMGKLRSLGIMQPQTLTISELSVESADKLFERTNLRPGDKVKVVNGKDVWSHWEFAQIIENALVPSVDIMAERVGEDGGVKLVRSNIELGLNIENRNPKSESDLEHVFSMVPRMRLTFVTPEHISFIQRIVSRLLNLFGKEMGVEEKPRLHAGDIITRIGDIENPTYKGMRDITEAHESKELLIKVLRFDPNGQEKRVDVTVVPKKENDRVLIGLIPDYDSEHPVIEKTISVEHVPDGLDIPRGASIMAVDGVAVMNFFDIIREIRKNAGQRITIDWRVDVDLAGNVAFDVRDIEQAITVKSGLKEYIPFALMERLYKADGPLEALCMGFRRTRRFLTESLLTLRRLVGGLISPKNFMGPVGIFHVSYQVVAHRPLTEYAYFLGLLSVFLGVINSVPLLPFDGGHIVFLLIEKIKGSPVNERIQEVVLYVGLAVVLMFFLYVTFNDIMRW
ncbi:MAG: site-2 protease family protein [Planctomycetota bacterium]|jgi:regulator of sigma E protease